MSSGTVEECIPRQLMPMVSSGPCWVCGGTNRKRVWRDPFDLSDHPRYGPHAHGDHPDTWLVRCSACGFAQPEALPGVDNYFDLLYADQPWLTEESMRLDFDRGSKDFVFREILADVGRELGPRVPRTLLDVGSYTGRFLSLAAAAGYETEGIELNTRAADFASRKTGRPIHRIKAQDLAAEGRKFGVVSFIDVLEHIPRPASLVAQLRELLAPGGVLVIKVPHGSMQRFKERLRGLVHRGPEARRAANIGVMTRFVHVNHFTVGSLRRLLSAAGFSPVKVRVAGPEFHVDPNRPTPSERRSAAGRVAVYRAARAIPGGVYSPLSMQLLGLAVNPGRA
jgi:SAM-dependent methyltransferase